MDGKSYLQILDETSSRLSAETRSRLLSENEIITEGFKLLNSVFHALAGYSEQDEEASDLLKSARTTLALHISKTLQAAFVLQERDMTAQSMCLCRNALEAAYVWRRLEENPKSAENWLDITSEDTREFWFGKLLRATDEDAKARRFYRFLCKFSHPSGMTFWSGVAITPSDYSIGFRRLCCVCILNVTKKFLRLVEGRFAGRPFRNDDVCLDWQHRSLTVAERMLSDFEREVGQALGGVGDPDWPIR